MVVRFYVVAGLNQIALELLAALLSVAAKIMHPCARIPAKQIATTV